MTMQLPAESLSTLTTRIQKALSGAASEPLEVSGTVVALADNWERYKVEAGGLSASEWLTKTFGRGHGLRWFQLRAEAVERLGEASRRTWDHFAAVWAAGNIKDELSLRRLAKAVMEHRLANGKNPVPTGVVVRIAKTIGVWGGKPKPAQHCARCEALEKALRAAGVAVPE